MQVELAFIQADLHRVQKAVSDLAVNAHKSERELQLKLERKELIIKGLQETLRNVAKDKKMLENKLRNVTLAGISDGAESEIDELRKENKELKQKLKAKARKIRQYKYALEDVVGDGYEDDPDEEDGEPDEDSVGAEDVEMVDEETLLNEEYDEDTDPDDSDFELNDRDKAKMERMKAERKNDENKNEEKEQETEQAEESEKELTNDDL